MDAGRRVSLCGWQPAGRISNEIRERLPGKYTEWEMEPWKTFGAETGAGVSSVVAPHLSSDGTAYAYLYVRVLSEAYVVTGLR